MGWYAPLQKVHLIVTGEAIIWNPSIRRLVFLPNPTVNRRNGFAKCAFGYDPSTNDYKVLRSIVHDSDEIPCEVELWSLARGSWKSLSLDMVPANFRPRKPDGRGRHDYGQHVFVNGALHWVQPCNINSHKSIVLFSMSSESFGEITMPEVLREDLHDCYMLRYSESLALLFEEDFDSYTSVHLWVMKEYGVAESWTKLSTVRVASGSFLKPYCFRKNGELLFNVLPGSGDWRWMSSNNIQKRIRNGKCHYDFMESFIESIALLHQPNFYSYFSNY